MRVVDSNFVVHKDGALVHTAFKTVHSCSAKRQTSFYLSYSPVMVQRLTSLTTRFRESHGSIGMGCE